MNTSETLFFDLHCLGVTVFIQSIGGHSSSGDNNVPAYIQLIGRVAVSNRRVTKFAFSALSRRHGRAVGLNYAQYGKLGHN